VPDPAAPGRLAELRAALDGTPSGLGPAVAPAEATRSFARARAALHLATDEDREELVVAAEHRTALLLRDDPSLVGEIADDRLAPLAGETPASRTRLESTLLAWLRHDGAVAAAAAELHVHPQTLRYRLGRLRELYSDSLDDPDSRFELELVLRAGSASRRH
jgi:DNA-binding PucR family transcriptional regulator